MRSESGNTYQASADEAQPRDDYSVRLVDLARNSREDLQVATQIAAPPRVASTSRPALGARLLSSLSNTQPTAAALTRKGSVLHSRAKSLAAFVPKLNGSNTSTSEKPQSAASRTIGDLFHGESAPVRLGPPVSPTKEKEESELIMDYRSVFTERPGLLRRRETAPQNVPTSTSTSKPASSTSWFSRKTTNPIVPKQQQQRPQDELVTLNINSALFPHGPADPLDPTAFNNLLLNATNLLHRMQTAYREKVEYIASIRPEQEAQKDEVEGAETRVVHLKKQLEDMSRKAHEQETTMREMAAELAEERMKTLEAEDRIKRLEAREAATNTIRLVSSSTEGEGDHGNSSSSRRAKRRGSTSNASDSGFESDMESIFSSYGGGPAVPDTPLSPPCLSRMPSFESRLNINVLQANALHDQTKPTAVGGTSTATYPTTAGGGSGRSGGQQQQRLGREGAAWATVETLRSENRELKRYVVEMQEGLQGCIEFVSSQVGHS